MKFQHLATGQIYDDGIYTPKCPIKCEDCEASMRRNPVRNSCGTYLETHPHYLELLGYKAIPEPGDPGYTEPAAEEKWIDIYECPFCHCHVNIPTNFCPNCGKKLSK